MQEGLVLAHMLPHYVGGVSIKFCLCVSVYIFAPNWSGENSSLKSDSMLSGPFIE